MDPADLQAASLPAVDSYLLAHVEKYRLTWRQLTAKYFADAGWFRANNHFDVVQNIGYPVLLFCF